MTTNLNAGFAVGGLVFMAPIKFYIPSVDKCKDVTPGTYLPKMDHLNQEVMSRS